MSLAPVFRDASTILFSYQIGLAEEVANGMWGLLVREGKATVIPARDLERILRKEVERVFRDPAYDAECIPQDATGRQSFHDHVLRTVLQLRANNGGYVAWGSWAELVNDLSSRYDLTAPPDNM
jgi:hypothetical protein